MQNQQEKYVRSTSRIEATAPENEISSRLFQPSGEELEQIKKRLVSAVQVG